MANECRINYKKVAYIRMYTCVSLAVQIYDAARYHCPDFLHTHRLQTRIRDTYYFPQISLDEKFFFLFSILRFTGTCPRFVHR